MATGSVRCIISFTWIVRTSYWAYVDIRFEDGRGALHLRRRPWNLAAGAERGAIFFTLRNTLLREDQDLFKLYWLVSQNFVSHGREISFPAEFDSIDHNANCPLDGSCHDAGAKHWSFGTLLWSCAISSYWDKPSKCFEYAQWLIGKGARLSTLHSEYKPCRFTFKLMW